MNIKELVANEGEVTLGMTERADELLHMILDLHKDKEVDLYRMQSLVLSMYRDEIDFVHSICELERELDARRKKVIELPKFMISKEEEKEAQ